MGLPSIINFDISFIGRTKKNLDGYTGEFDFTMLLNSLLGLIVVPKESKEERVFTFDFLSKRLDKFSEVSHIFQVPSHRVIKDGREVEYRKFFWLSDNDSEIGFKDVTLDAFLSRMRHGIAHFGFTPLACPDRKDEWCGVIIRNLREDKDPQGRPTKTLNFEVCLMQNELGNLAEFISQKYLDSAKAKKRRPTI